MEKIEELIELKRQMSELRNTIWANEVLFSFNWWFLLVLAVVPWVIWWLFLSDKKKITTVLVFGLQMSVAATLLDDMGSYFLLWIYESQLAPFTPRLNPINLTVIPITYMLIYQNFSSWKSFLLALVILSFGASYIVEPIFTYMGIYKMLDWHYIYSFIIYIILGVINKLIVDKYVRVQMVK